MADLESLIRDIPDFPKPGIVFKDITPLLGDPDGLRESIEQLAKTLQGVPCDMLAGIESRGFLFGAALAQTMGVGFIPIRKPGKLPYDVVKQEYSLEYGTDCIEMHSDAVKVGQSVVIVDDLIATGGTAAAACSLIEGVGGKVSALTFVIALDFLPWREKLGDRDVRALLRYS
jgi:adenine phosphoribosyltransferase